MWPRDAKPVLNYNDKPDHITQTPTEYNVVQ